MSIIRTPHHAIAKRQRPTGPHCRGGASSLLRLTQPQAPRLPTPLEVADWMSRAAGALARSDAAALR